MTAADHRDTSISQLHHRPTPLRTLRANLPFHPSLRDAHRDRRPSLRLHRIRLDYRSEPQRARMPLRRLEEGRQRITVDQDQIDPSHPSLRGRDSHTHRRRLHLRPWRRRLRAVDILDR